MNFLPECVLILLTMLFFLGFGGKPKKYHNVSVIIPAFNEEKSIEHVINVVKSISSINQIIVVDDGSDDNTYDIVSHIPGVLLLHHKHNKGKGSAMNTGLKKVDNDVILFLDADLCEISKKQVEAIINPILNGDADITKTKFKRAAGRVTELTAKPLLQFFFPELGFDQPLSGQFATTKKFIDTIDLENDYGVDIGIILDAEAQGLKIVEVDIGSIVHDHSTLKELNLMANEVVRTIVDRAINYGRLTMVDDLGNSIRMEIMGLSLITFGIFGIFFIKFMNLIVSVAIIVIGLIISIYYIVRIIKMSIRVYRQSNLSSREMIVVFMKTHFPIIISIIILLFISASLLGSVSISSNQISIEPISKNMIIPTSSHSNQSVDIRGPYIISNALENEQNLIRLPTSALNTLQANYGDYIYINDERYQLDQSVNRENDLIRIPSDAREALDVEPDTTIRDSDLKSEFDGAYLVHNIDINDMSNETINNTTNVNLNTTNMSVGTYLTDDSTDEMVLTVYINNTEFVKTKASIEENATYSIYINGQIEDNLKINTTTNGSVFNMTYDNNTIVNVTMESTNSTSNVKFANDQSYVKFLNIHINDTSD